MKGVNEILSEKKKKPFTKSQHMRFVLLEQWQHEITVGLTALDSEAFYEKEMDKIIRDIRSKIPDKRYNPEDYGV